MVLSFSFLGRCFYIPIQNHMITKEQLYFTLVFSPTTEMRLYFWELLGFVGIEGAGGYLRVEDHSIYNC